MDLDAVKAKELAKLDRLELTYWRAWERSCSTREIRSVTKKGEAGTSMLRTEGRDGNPKFLEGVHKCIERRCVLLGLDAPAKKEVSGPGGEPMEVHVYIPDNGRGTKPWQS
jgi:hypothetical protein